MDHVSTIFIHFSKSLTSLKISFSAIFAFKNRPFLEQKLVLFLLNALICVIDELRLRRIRTVLTILANYFPGTYLGKGWIVRGTTPRRLTYRVYGLFYPNTSHYPRARNFVIAVGRVLRLWRNTHWQLYTSFPLKWLRASWERVHCSWHQHQTISLPG